MKKKLDLVPGIRYKGYALVNEYGQIQFDPEEKGAHEGRIKEVKRGDNYIVKESREYILLSIKVKRGETALDRVQNLMNVVNQLVNIFKEYDF